MVGGNGSGFLFRVSQKVLEGVPPNRGSWLPPNWNGLVAMTLDLLSRLRAGEQKVALHSVTGCSIEFLLLTLLLLITHLQERFRSAVSNSL